jgi:nucleoside-diphosphate-sugar epimerase
VEDAVRATIFCAETQTRELFNIGNDREITIQDAVKVIAKEFGHKDPDWTTTPGRAGSTATRRPNIDKLKSVMPDYKPMKFEQGVKRIIKNLVDKS